MSLRIVITRAAPEGGIPETIEVEWEDQALAPDGAHIVALVNGLIGGLVEDGNIVPPMPQLRGPVAPDDSVQRSMHRVGADLLAGERVEIRAMGQRVIWPASDVGTPAGTVSQDVSQGDYVVNERGGAGGVPVWRKQ